jgi:hypothetical protein
VELQQQEPGVVAAAAEAPIPLIQEVLVAADAGATHLMLPMRGLQILAAAVVAVVAMSTKTAAQAVPVSSSFVIRKYSFLQLQQLAHPP